jgi:dTDP-4-amino-4,6-dideoxygalactose transaminase
MQKAYTWLNYRPSDFPVVRRIAAEIVSLPMFPQLTATQQSTVVAEIETFVDRPLTKQPPENEGDAVLTELRA